MITLILFFRADFFELSSAWKYSFLFMQRALYSMGAVENLEKTPASCQPRVANRCNLHYNTCIMTLKRDRTWLAGCASRITSKIPFLTFRDVSGFVPIHCLVNWIQRQLKKQPLSSYPWNVQQHRLSLGWAEDPRILALWGGKQGDNSTPYCATCVPKGLLTSQEKLCRRDWEKESNLSPFFRGWWWTVHCSNSR